MPRTKAPGAARDTQPLDFDDTDRAPPRSGEPLPEEEVRAHLPPVRERFAGRTEGEVTLGQTTADDMAPEVLLDDDPSHTPAARARRVPADTQMSVATVETIGAGGGRDEAEDAQVDPIDESEHRRLQKRAARAGGSLKNFEPHESAAGSPARARYRKK